MHTHGVFPHYYKLQDVLFYTSPGIGALNDDNCERRNHNGEVDGARSRSGVLLIPLLLVRTEFN